jgi:hypothetical protein
MSKHTPGPWRYEEFGPNVIIKATKNPMLSVVHSLYHESREQMEANADLIAAAPELLEALEKMVGLFEPGRIYDFKEVSALSSEALHIAMAAIAKAKGD